MQENPPLAKLKAVKLGDYYDFAAFCATILQIKEAFTNNLNSGYDHTRPGCCSNYTLTKSNCLIVLCVVLWDTQSVLFPIAI